MSIAIKASCAAPSVSAAVEIATSTVSAVIPASAAVSRMSFKTSDVLTTPHSAAKCCAAAVAVALMLWLALYARSRNTKT